MFRSNVLRGAFSSESPQFRRAPALISLIIAMLPSVSIAQTDPPPITPQAKYSAAENKIDVIWTRCTIGNDPQTCPSTYAIYRTPPANAATVNPTFPLPLTGVELRNLVVTWPDPTAQPGVSYSYLVCTGSAKEAGQKNCAATNAVSIPVPPAPAPTSNCTQPTDSPCASPGFSPPTDVRATGDGNVAIVQWVNPPSNFPVPLIQINSNQFSQYNFDDVLVSLPATGTTLPTKHSWDADGGPGTLIPHNTLAFQVCEGIGYLYFSSQTNCTKSNSVNVGGLDPVMSVSASGKNAAKVTVVVDNPANLTAIDVNRQESDDPVRQGTTLGNGLQGCREPVPGSGITCINAPVFHLDVTQRTPDASGSLVKTFVLGVDSGLTPGVTYYYTATATWFGSMGQTSEVVSFKDSLVLIPLRIPRGALAQIPGIQKNQPVSGQKTPVGVAPPPASATTAQLKESLVPSALSAVRLARPMPGSAADLLARGQSFCSSGIPDVCANVLEMAYMRAHMTNDPATATAAQQALAVRGQRITLP